MTKKQQTLQSTAYTLTKLEHTIGVLKGFNEAFHPPPKFGLNVVKSRYRLRSKLMLFLNLLNISYLSIKHR